MTLTENECWALRQLEIPIFMLAERQWDESAKTITCPLPFLEPRLEVNNSKEQHLAQSVDLLIPGDFSRKRDSRRRRVIKEGLSANDRVVVNDLMRVPPGQRVTPEEPQAPQQATAPQAKTY